MGKNDIFGTLFLLELLGIDVKNKKINNALR